MAEKLQNKRIKTPNGKETENLCNGWELRWRDQIAQPINIVALIFQFSLIHISRNEGRVRFQFNATFNWILTVGIWNTFFLFYFLFIAFFVRSNVCNKFDFIQILLSIQRYLVHIPWPCLRNFVNSIKCVHNQNAKRKMYKMILETKRNNIFIFI